MVGNATTDLAWLKAKADTFSNHWALIYRHVLCDRNIAIRKQAPDAKLWPDPDDRPNIDLKTSIVDMTNCFHALQTEFGADEWDRIPEYVFSGMVFDPSQRGFNPWDKSPQIPLAEVGNGRLLQIRAQLEPVPGVSLRLRQMVADLKNFDQDAKWWEDHFIEPSRCWYDVISMETRTKCEWLETALNPPDTRKSMYDGWYAFAKEYKDKHPGATDLEAAKKYRQQNSEFPADQLVSALRDHRKYEKRKQNHV